MFSIVLCGATSLVMFCTCFGMMEMMPESPVAVLPGLMGVGFFFLTANALDERQKQKAKNSRKASGGP